MPGSDDRPAGAGDISGVANRRSPYSVTDTVDRLTSAISEAGAQLFSVVDHSGEAERVGLALRDTKLLIFGSPAAGTPVMEESPLSALDLPLKVLVWRDDVGVVWMSYLSGTWLSERHGVAIDVAKPLSAPDVLTGGIAGA